MPQTKGNFPYVRLTNLEKLDDSKLVAQEHFWSDLKQEDISDEDYRCEMRVDLLA